MNTLKQLQENMKKEYIKWYEEYDGIPMQDTIANWWLKQTTLAFEASKAEAIAMVLKEIEKIKRNNPLGERSIIIEEALETLKNKLQAKE